MFESRHLQRVVLELELSTDKTNTASPILYGNLFDMAKVDSTT